MRSLRWVTVPSLYRSLIESLDFPTQATISANHQDSYWGKPSVLELFAVWHYNSFQQRNDRQKRRHLYRSFENGFDMAGNNALTNASLVMAINNHNGNNGGPIVLSNDQVDYLKNIHDILRTG